MGAKHAQLIDDDAVRGVATRVLSVFLPLYIKAFGLSLVDVEIRVRRLKEHGRADEIDYHLLKPPIAEVPLRRGWVRLITRSLNKYKNRFRSGGGPVWGCRHVPCGQAVTVSVCPRPVA